MYDYIIGIVLFVIAGVLQYAAMGEWDIESRGSFVFFRKPLLLRIASAVWILPWLWLVWFSWNNMSAWDPPVAWFSGAFGVFLACGSLYGCGPADVTVEVDARMCHAIVGLIGMPNRFSCPLTDKSSIVIAGTSGSGPTTYTVRLWTQHTRKYSFTLAVTNNGSDAQSFADEISRLINVPVE